MKISSILTAALLILPALPSVAASGSLSQNPVCGNGVLEEGEECDNGVRNSDLAPDACRSDCRLPRCGDGVADSNEECDGRDLKGLHFAEGKPHCDENCKLVLPVCGDGILDDFPRTRFRGKWYGGEECDDGNQDATDGCLPDCRECVVVDRNLNLEEVDKPVLICPGTFALGDYGSPGALVVERDNVVLDCMDSAFLGDGRGVGLYIYNSRNVTVKNCLFTGYTVGVELHHSTARFQNVTVCGNERRDWKLSSDSRILGRARGAYAGNLNIRATCPPWVEQRISGQRSRVRSPVQSPSRHSSAILKMPSAPWKRGGMGSVARRRLPAGAPSRAALGKRITPAARIRLVTVALNDLAASSGDSHPRQSTATLADGSRVHDALVLEVSRGSSASIRYPQVRPSKRSVLKLRLAVREAAPAARITWTVSALTADGQAHRLFQRTVLGTAASLPASFSLRGYANRPVSVQVEVRYRGSGPQRLHALSVHPVVTQVPRAGN